MNTKYEIDLYRRLLIDKCNCMVRLGELTPDASEETLKGWKMQAKLYETCSDKEIIDRALFAAQTQALEEIAEGRKHIGEITGAPLEPYIFTRFVM